METSSVYTDIYHTRSVSSRNYAARKGNYGIFLVIFSTLTGLDPGFGATFGSEKPGLNGGLGLILAKV